MYEVTLHPGHLGENVVILFNNIFNMRPSLAMQSSTRRCSRLTFFVIKKVTTIQEGAAAPI